MEFLHQPPGELRATLLLTHGAGGNATAALLVAVAEEFAKSGVMVMRYDLPFRQVRRFGPPSPAGAAQDRAGLREAGMQLRQRAPGVPLLMGGHSYGGRQATILASEEPSAADALVLLSYPLHPPRKAEQPRTAHFPKLVTPALFVSGTRDEFGTPEELRKALELISGQTQLEFIDGAGHDLAKGKFDLAGRIVEPALRILG
jgi:predicted alpha/beta-hydrolase family hydrolase